MNSYNIDIFNIKHKYKNINYKNIKINYNINIVCGSFCLNIKLKNPIFISNK